MIPASGYIGEGLINVEKNGWREKGRGGGHLDNSLVCA